MAFPFKQWVIVVRGISKPETAIAKQDRSEAPQESDGYDGNDEKASARQGSCYFGSIGAKLRSWRPRLMLRQPQRAGEPTGFEVGDDSRLVVAELSKDRFGREIAATHGTFHRGWPTGLSPVARQ